jgi:hypothetical protein
MDMHAAYQEVGSYRAAAEICGTTDKTVKRVIEAAQVVGSPGERFNVLERIVGVACLAGSDQSQMLVSEMGAHGPIATR